jgi:hypothetical protein
VDLRTCIASSLLVWMFAEVARSLGSPENEGLVHLQLLVEACTASPWMPSLQVFLLESVWLGMVAVKKLGCV